MKTVQLDYVLYCVVWERGVDINTDTFSRKKAMMIQDYEVSTCYVRQYMTGI